MFYGNCSISLFFMSSVQEHRTMVATPTMLSSTLSSTVVLGTLTRQKGMAVKKPCPSRLRRAASHEITFGSPPSCGQGITGIRVPRRTVVPHVPDSGLSMWICIWCTGLTAWSQVAPTGTSGPRRGEHWRRCTMKVQASVLLHLVVDVQMFDGLFSVMTGLCRSIGVSNFLIPHLEELKQECGMMPHVNQVQSNNRKSFLFVLKFSTMESSKPTTDSFVSQVEFHPFQQPWKLKEFCCSEGIAFEGYCPLAKGQALCHPLIMELGQKYGRSASQICIRWSIQV